jgi:hypothetical protein
MKRCWLWAWMVGACAAPRPAATTPALPATIEPNVEARSESVAVAPPVARGPTREQRRFELAQEVASQPGWSLYETEHYFIISAVDDAAFVDELKRRCEGARDLIERDFPHPAAAPVPVRTAPHVLRACKSREQYAAYGGAAGSSGYWSDFHRELVLYDDREGGRRNTWATLNSIVFMEYASELSDGDVAAPWFLYGHADYYAGFQPTRDGCELEPFDWRQRLAQVNIRTDGTVPLEQFVRLHQNDYYVDAGNRYAQGWALIYFLREGAHSSQSWNPAWNGILDAWWRTWIETRDADAANERAFAGVDWRALEASWKDFTLRN